DHADHRQAAGRRRHCRVGKLHRRPACRRCRRHGDGREIVDRSGNRSTRRRSEPLDATRPEVMRVRLFAVLLGMVFAGAAAAAAPAPAVPSPYVEGTDYFLIDPPQRSGVDGKIEVTEAFSYGCPACNFAYPYFEKIRKGLPANAVMTYVPASFKPNEDWPMFQRAYLAAQALGIADKAHTAMFDAIWKDKTLAIMNPDG